MLAGLPRVTDPNALVGADAADDSAVYKLNDQQAVVQSLDFFTPIVDDPGLFGEIAAANAISDIYATGGRPLFGLNIVGFPLEKLGPQVLGAILAGGSRKAVEAGMSILGGHSIDDAEPKYGMCVTGIVHPDKIMANSGAKVGDTLVLTKPLGVGVLTTAVKRGLRSEGQIEAAIHTMASLNRPGGLAMDAVGAHTCTDITGFGLIGHLHEVAAASGVSIELSFDALPLLDEVMDLIGQGCVPGGTKKNRKHYGQHVTFEGLSEAEELLVSDAQTSGGLVISVAPEKADAMVASLREHGALASHVIGKVCDGPTGTLRVGR